MRQLEQQAIPAATVQPSRERRSAGEGKSTAANPKNNKQEQQGKGRISSGGMVGMTEDGKDKILQGAKGQRQKT